MLRFQMLTGDRTGVPAWRRKAHFRSAWAVYPELDILKHLYRGFHPQLPVIFHWPVLFVAKYWYILGES